MVTSQGRLLLYAPNVHVGGGAVLLEALLRELTQGWEVHAWLDMRARTRLQLPPELQVRWVHAQALDRLRAEWSLNKAARSGDRVLCFHGLPPLLPCRGTVHVFVQNRLHLGQLPLGQFSWRTRLRLFLEQQVARLCRGNVGAYWVQTPSMHDALRKWAGAWTAPPIHILGFAPALDEPSAVPKSVDFVYVADGVAHKNHVRLIEAWALLAAEGVRPSLALTLSQRDQELKVWIEQQAAQHALRVEWIPPLSHAEVRDLYGRSGALVFPSLTESYGLPLIEAASAGLPIVAGELDYVRDVCVPAQTFDPHSPRSIARAVKRQLGQRDAPEPVARAGEFLAALMERGVP